MARLGKPALASSDIGESRARGTTSVSGPGQKASASFRATALKVPSGKASASDAT